MIFHQHAVVHRLGFACAARAALLVVVDEDRAVRHQVPTTTHEHPFVRGHRGRLPPCAGSGVRGGQLSARMHFHIHLAHVVGRMSRLGVLRCGRRDRGHNADENGKYPLQESFLSSLGAKEKSASSGKREDAEKTDYERRQWIRFAGRSSPANREKNESGGKPCG